MSDATEVTLYIGDVYASRDAAVIKTVLGSCISACLRDPVARIGGMNHFMLPTPCNGDVGKDLSRFGLHAMELLIGEIQKLGGERARLQAKVFGGGHVLQMAESDNAVPQRNVRFIRQFLVTERIPLVAHDLGGRVARQVVYHTASGSVLLKRLSGQGGMASRMEQEHQALARQRTAEYGEVTLFGE